VSKLKENNGFKGEKPMQYSLDDRIEVQCYNCHTKGHFKLSFPENERNEKGKKILFQEGIC